jgi:hypothetical protein
MVWRGDANRGELGGMLIHCMDGGDRVGRVIKTKIIVEFSNYFFLASQANYIKLSVVTLHQLLP